jgi:hypothetical protein
MQARVKLALAVSGCVAAILAVGAGPASAQSVTLKTDMSGAEQCATGTPCDPDATGKATITLLPASNTVCFTIKHRNVDPTQAGHIHKAPPGQNNLVIAVNLYASPGVQSSISDCVLSDPLTIQDIIMNPTAFYVQEHNQQFPEGALRGQLGD